MKNMTLASQMDVVASLCSYKSSTRGLIANSRKIGKLCVDLLDLSSNITTLGSYRITINSRREAHCQTIHTSPSIRRTLNIFSDID